MATCEAFSAVLVVPSEYETIQQAIDSALTGDTVLIQAGIYSEAALVPSKGLTLASNYLLSGDTLDIPACTWRGFSNGDDSLRCLTVEDDGGANPSVRVVGIRFAGSATHNGDEGGAILVVRQNALIDHCLFDSCSAGFGGAAAIHLAQARFVSCQFRYCGANRFAAVLRTIGSQVWVDSCLFFHTTPHHEVDEIPEQIAMRNSVLRIRDSQVNECGLDHNPSGTYFVLVSKPPDTLEIVGTKFWGNHFTHFVSRFGGTYISLLRIDSCNFLDNTLTGAVFLQSGPDSLTTFTARGNVFETFSPVPMLGMHGVFGLDNTRATVQISRNLILHNSGGHTSFCTIFERSRAPRTVSHNYIVENSNHSVSWPPSGQVLLRDNDPTDLEYNVFRGNIGYAVFQGLTPDSTFARHNYWNSASGPYDSVGNSLGQGDTVEWRISYQPWETDTSFFAAAPEPPAPVEVPESFIGNAYPNPFNATVTIEFVLLRDQEIVLSVYDLNGRKVSDVFNGRMRKGVHIREWSPQRQASGIYFANLRGDDGQGSTLKLLYLK